MTLEEGYGFALKSLVKTMETTTPSPKKIELVSIGFNMEEKIQTLTISEDRIKELLKEHGLTVAEEPKEK
jgi:20S proteasome subunit alpha 3